MKPHLQKFENERRLKMLFLRDSREGQLTAQPKQDWESHGRTNFKIWYTSIYLANLGVKALNPSPFPYLLNNEA